MSTLNNGSLMPDPTNAGHMALTLMLPTIVANGDVSVAHGPSLPLSDFLRFTDPQGRLVGTTADRLLYYSDIESPQPPGEGRDLADVGIPSRIPNANVLEMGTEDMFETFNYASGTNNNIYAGTSDFAMAEPASLALLGVSLAGLTFIRSRRNPH